MDLNKTIFPSTKMLPMTDIATELDIIHGFQKKTEKALDVEYVGNVSSSNIAKIAINEEGNPYVYFEEDGITKRIQERESVKNAIYLNGKKSDEYMTKSDGQRIENFGANVSQVYSDDVSSLRDELYQLIGELTRKGFVAESGLYSGFQDFFKTSDKKFLHKEIIKNDEIIETIDLCGLSASFVNSTNVNKIIPNISGIIKKDDWFIISKTDTGEHYLVKATKVETITSEEEITFESSISTQGIPSIDNREAVIITKVHGDYYNGTFSFSKIEKYALTNEEKYVIMNDDSNPSMEKITADQTGYAATFKMPQLVAGALKGFSIMTRISGAPGALTCYVVEEKDIISINNLSIEEVGADKMVIAKSKPVSCLYSSTVNLTETKFDFIDPISYKYPILSGEKRYCFIIVAEKASIVDSWEIQFSRNASSSINPDLQTNNSAYSYVQGAGLTIKSAIGDLVFILNTIIVKENSESPRTDGLYTSEKIAINNNSSLARARLTLRINKEGLLKSETKGIVNDNGIIRTKIAGINPENLGIKTDDTIIIGKEIRKAVYDVTNRNITIDKAVSVEENDSVYRVGYKAFLRAIKKEWVVGAKPEYNITSDLCIPMELIAVMPDRTHVGEDRSDRLIFECEFRDINNMPIDANEFQLQIVWKSNVSTSDMISNKSYVGRIYDISLSFDKIL